MSTETVVTETVTTEETPALPVELLAEVIADNELNAEHIEELETTLEEVVELNEQIALTEQEQIVWLTQQNELTHSIISELSNRVAELAALLIPVASEVAAETVAEIVEPETAETPPSGEAENPVLETPAKAARVRLI